MANDFAQMYGRVTTQLRRSNLTAEAKLAVNDAIEELSKTRFYFNEMRGVSFVTVAGTQYYTDPGLIEIDAAYYTQSGTRYGIEVHNDIDLDLWAEGNAISGRPETISRKGESIRFDPIPDAVYTIVLDGYGKLTPWPLVNDADTNAWMTTGERMVRALAKRNLLRDVVKDYGEARVYEAIAVDLIEDFRSETQMRQGTGTLTGTQF